MCNRKAQNVPQLRKVQNVPQEGTKCATARHKKTFRLMCHRKAQNVPFKIDSLDLDDLSLEKNNKNNKAIIRAGRAALAAKNLLPVTT
jgi:hypothetical protein